MDKKYYTNLFLEQIKILEDKKQMLEELCDILNSKFKNITSNEDDCCFSGLEQVTKDLIRAKYSSFFFHIKCDDDVPYNKIQYFPGPKEIKFFHKLDIIINNSTFEVYVNVFTVDVSDKTIDFSDNKYDELHHILDQMQSNNIYSYIDFVNMLNVIKDESVTKKFILSEKMKQRLLFS